VNKNHKKLLLGDAVLIRLFLILLLVLYHSLCVFCGSWEVPDGFTEIPVYWWMGKAASSFMLETFVFLSGYLYGVQIQKKGICIVNFKSMILRKVKRLLLPCFLFGSLYYVMFYDLSKSVSEIIYSILNGTGHLWFLPMLFWCFVCVYGIEKLHISQKVVIPLLTVAALCSILPLPFRLGKTMYYLLFFYVGYCIKRNTWNVERFFSGKYTAMCVALYLSSFVLFTIFNNLFLTGSISVGAFFGGGIDFQHVANKAYFCWIRFSSLCYSAFGTAMVFCGVNWLQKNNRLQVTQGMVKLSSLCFGVYICQQFI